MTAIRLIMIIGGAGALCACAGVHFSETRIPNALEYRTTVPAVVISLDGDCKTTTQVIGLPGDTRYVSFRSGLGKAVSAIDFNPGGTVAKVNMTTEGQVKDALDIASMLLKVGGVGINAAPSATPEKCTPGSVAYLIRADGNTLTVDKTPLFAFDVQKEIKGR